MELRVGTIPKKCNVSNHGIAHTMEELYQENQWTACIEKNESLPIDNIMNSFKWTLCVASQPTIPIGEILL